MSNPFSTIITREMSAIKYIENLISLLPGIELTLSQFLGGILVLSITGLVCLWILKRHYSSFSAELLSKKYALEDQSFAQARNKFPEVNISALRPTLLLIGFISSLALVAGAINLTQEVHYSTYIWTELPPETDLEILPPNTAREKPLPKTIQRAENENNSLPATQPLSKPKPLLHELDIDQTLSENKLNPKIKMVPIVTSREEDNPPPTPSPTATPELRITAQYMPAFPGCEDLGSEAERRQCTTANILAHVRDHLRYPDIAKNAGIQGKVYVRFVVDTDGAITDIKIMRGLGHGCDQEAERVIQKLNSLPKTWQPGRQNGQLVRVQYTLPISFKLN